MAGERNRVDQDLDAINETRRRLSEKLQVLDRRVDRAVRTPKAIVSDVLQGAETMVRAGSRLRRAIAHPWLAVATVIGMAVLWKKGLMGFKGNGRRWSW